MTQSLHFNGAEVVFYIDCFFKISIDSFLLDRCSPSVRRDGKKILLVNWSDAEKRMELDLASNGFAPSEKLRNFWNDSPVELRNGKITAELAPRSCLLAVEGK